MFDTPYTVQYQWATNPENWSTLCKTGLTRRFRSIERAVRGAMQDDGNNARLYRILWRGIIVAELKLARP